MYHLFYTVCLWFIIKMLRSFIQPTIFFLCNFDVSPRCCIVWLTRPKRRHLFFFFWCKARVCYEINENKTLEIYFVVLFCNNIGCSAFAQWLRSRSASVCVRACVISSDCPLKKLTTGVFGSCRLIRKRWRHFDITLILCTCDGVSGACGTIDSDPNWGNKVNRQLRTEP